MKSPARFLLLIIASSAIISFYSCDKKNTSENNATGKAEFSFSINNQTGAAKSATSDSGLVTYQLMISIEDLNGKPVMTDKLIPVYAFGSGFISEKIEIRAGEYNLTKFLVIDPSGQVLLASPLEGSPLAYITNDPLPVYFNVLPDQVTSVVPEVIMVGSYTPADFGYVNFGVRIIKPLEFYAICFLDNPLIMAPTQITDARLTVYSADGWYYSFDLKPEINHLIIRGGSDLYTFVVEKEGYVSQTYQFTAAQLINATKENPLGLKIPWGPQYSVLELQPDPAAGKDAMISNLEPDRNFGDYKYFETTFLTEPVLTVMRSNRSLISFDISALPKSATIQKVTLRLWYDIPVPFDSLDVANTDPGTGVNFIGAVLQQVIEPWDEAKVTWNHQPGTTEIGQVYLYPFIKNANVIELDVTSLFNNPSASLLPNYGMLFRLWPEDKFPGFRFVSSDYSEASMRPKLIIQYTQ
jgi:hypothetical protein